MLSIVGGCPVSYSFETLAAFDRLYRHNHKSRGKASRGVAGLPRTRRSDQISDFDVTSVEAVRTGLELTARKRNIDVKSGYKLPGQRGIFSPVQGLDARETSARKLWQRNVDKVKEMHLTWGMKRKVDHS
jgi:hypothetical protein